MTSPPVLDGWVQGIHTADGRTHPTYRRGTGPGVVVIHELPGITPEVVAFAEEVVAEGFTVVMPHLFGTPGAPGTVGEVLRVVPRVCVNREFTILAAGRTSPVAGWLRSLARELHQDVGGPGVGVVGMCFTGGFALATMVDPSVAAPVVAQPSLPMPVGKRRKADLGLSPADLDSVKSRVAQGCSVLGVRYDGDPATGTRFETLQRELGDGFLRVDLPSTGRGQHATLTAHRSQEAVDRVLAFFRQRLQPS
ncbi:dienelactone hydrolase family protein [Phycicoccus sp. SLBN-51]|jgi:dienelactone hydrolase|uniref:dienelactone hydrolase family protein n=1 Tax=Phycicoccus sp. SLBN-51 TaxID=2768447 RepID=UPI0011510A03|nr:dienelactone hydrolase family protein [Phycicoccus sp. SLBN-51]TQJ50240.1 dienelactone hydrolase [Phycicoccus sp. SLBN-51]